MTYEDRHMKIIVLTSYTVRVWQGMMQLLIIKFTWIGLGEKNMSWVKVSLVTIKK